MNLMKIGMLAFVSMLWTACAESGAGVTDVPAGSSSSSVPSGTLDFSRAQEVNRNLGRGMNVGNALESECFRGDPDHEYMPDQWDGCWNNPIKEEYFSIIKNAGFQSVRIPVRWAEKASDTAPYTIYPSFTARVKEVVDQALAHGLLVIINIHHFNELYDEAMERDDFDVQREKFLYLWDQIADTFKNYSNDSLVFEMLNEGRGRVSTGILNQMLADVWPRVRATNPERTLMINPANWGAYASLADVVVPDSDPNVILSGHFYKPHEFTHQGTSGQYPVGVVWGNVTEKNNLYIAIESVYAKLKEKYVGIDGGTIPINIGEFGASESGDIASRAAFAEAVRVAAEQRGMSWHYWGFTGTNFDAWSRGLEAWYPEILSALIPK